MYKLRILIQKQRPEVVFQLQLQCTATPDSTMAYTVRENGTFELNALY